jgi:hypothetical protein
MNALPSHPSHAIVFLGSQRDSRNRLDNRRGKKPACISRRSWHSFDELVDDGDDGDDDDNDDGDGDDGDDGDAPVAMPSMPICRLLRPETRWPLDGDLEMLVLLLIMSPIHSMYIHETNLPRRCLCIKKVKKRLILY